MWVSAAPVPPPPTATSVVTEIPTLPSAVIHAALTSDPLFSWWVPIWLALATIAILVACLVLRRRRHRRRWSLLAIGTGTLAGLVLTAASAVNVYAGYLPTVAAVDRALFGGTPGAPPPAVVADHGVQVSLPLAEPGSQQASAAVGSPTSNRWQLRTVHLSDPALGISRRSVIVALPPGYGLPDHRYPVAYMLSGYPGRPSDWIDAGRVLLTLDALAAKGLSPYYVLVMPDVNGGFLNDSEGLDQVGGPQVQTWLTTDVVSWVDAHYLTLPDRSHRVIAGMSSGGFAALNLSLRHQDTYGITLALEPYGDPGNVRNRLLGGSTDLLHANSPSWYAPTIPLHRVIDLFVDSGSRRRDAERTQELAALIAHRHEPVSMRVEAGQGHTWSEAAAGLPYALAYAAPLLGAADLQAVYPETDFPLGHRTRLSLLISADAQQQLEQRLACQRSIHSPKGPQRNAEISACLARRPPSAGPSPTASASASASGASR
jgi:enterochelin esterase-like enzyme